MLVCGPPRVLWHALYRIATCTAVSAQLQGVSNTDEVRVTHWPAALTPPMLQAHGACCEDCWGM